MNLACFTRAREFFQVALSGGLVIVRPFASGCVFVTRTLPFYNYGVMSHPCSVHAALNPCMAMVAAHTSMVSSFNTL